MRRLVATVSAVLAAAFVALVGAVPAGAQDNTAVAINTRDDSSVFKLAFSIKRVADDVADPTNAAVAYASCTNCETVAVAIQVVLLTGEPQVVSPENVAIAYNQDCDLCSTLASAYQFVFGTGGEPVHFSAETNKQLAQIRRQLQLLRHSDLSIQQIQAEVDRMARQVNQLVTAELERTRSPAPATATTTSTSGAGATTSTTGPPTTSTTTEEPATTTATSTATSTPATSATSATSTPPP